MAGHCDKLENAIKITPNKKMMQSSQKRHITGVSYWKD